MSRALETLTPSDVPAHPFQVDRGIGRVLELLCSRRILIFGAVGFSGVFVNLGMLFVCADVIRIDEALSSAIAIEVSIVWNFLFNNALTFSDRNAGARAGFFERMFRYNLVGLGGLALQLGTFVLLTRLAMFWMALPEPGIWKYPSQLAGIGAGMAWNFYTNFFWTWRQRLPAKTPVEMGDEA